MDGWKPVSVELPPQMGSFQIYSEFHEQFWPVQSCFQNGGDGALTEHARKSYEAVKVDFENDYSRLNSTNRQKVISSIDYYLDNLDLVLE